MNYRKIYYDLCDHCKQVEVIDRIKSRDSKDPRLGSEYIYTEKHHIVPRHSGGSDNHDNLVSLLPEEHYMAHLIRYKAYGERKDFLSVRFIVNGFKSKSNILERFPELFESRSFNTKIGLFKHFVQSFRKHNDWQTEDGRFRISEARRGTFPCIDLKTGEPVGSQSRDHPKVLSGEWVHHSKGKVCAILKDDNRRVHVSVSEYRNNPELYKFHRDHSGSKNANYKEMTENRRSRLFSLIVESIDDGKFLVKKRLDKLIRDEFKNDFKVISVNWAISHFGSLESLLEEYNLEFGTEYEFNPRYRSKIRNEQTSKTLIGKWAWVTDGSENKQISKNDVEEFLDRNQNFRRGRTV